MALFRKGERVREYLDQESGPGTIIDVLPGMNPYVVQWDAGGTTRVDALDLIREPRVDVPPAAPPAEGE